MKKYWKSIVIGAVIVLSIGTFYVNSALSATQYPEFVINNQSGNAEEIKSLVLQGSYHEEHHMNYANLKITDDGSDNRSDGSIIDQIIGSPEPMIMELQEEHRHFMRGKGYAIDSFFENNQLLAFAEVEYKMGSLSSRDFKFAISILDKEDGNTTSFTIKVPDSTGVDYIIVEDVQIVDNKLKLITQNMSRTNDKFYNKKRIYTFDLLAKQVTNQETIISTPVQSESDDTHIDARLIKTNPKQEYENLLFLKTESKITQQRESDYVEQSSQELISYNLRTKEKETIDLPENLKENQISFFDGSIIYLTEFSEHELVVTPFSMENNQAEDEFTIELTGATNNTPIMTVKDGKLFATTMVTNSKAGASVIVVDLSTGETLFTGEVEMKEAPKDMEEFELYIHNMSVR